ncbi:carbonic anhydrase [Lipomyces chichibuensis]|uniref:carbonic anhydrase n=1 Tax=Lipomyces chichibuensis TaxID=1546026 RepID=UPI003342E816
MSSQVIKEITAANDHYRASFANGSLPLPPARKLAIVACMDARLDPARVLGLQNGDAHVIRNAGGRSKDALRSIIISQQLLGTEEVLIIHHTDCGMLTFSDSQLHQILQERFNGNDVKDIGFLPFSDLEQSVRDDIEFLRASKVVSPKIRISGWIYEVETGRIRPVSD